MRQRTKPGPQGKATRDFPLGRHKLGYWIKKVRGKLHYFGKIVGDEDGQSALALWLEQKDELLAGRTPRKPGDYLTVADLCNQFLTHCDRKRAAGEMVGRTRGDYGRTCDRIVRVLGKGASVDGLRPGDFARLRDDMAGGNGPVTLSGEITRARVVFNFAYKNLLIDRPAQYGLAFQRPSAKTLRVARAGNGGRMIEAPDCRRLIKAAHTPELRAMVLLGLNCGFGNSDCARLPVAALDLAGGWIDYARPKTGVTRRCHLWPETAAALRVVLGRRQQGRPLMFITARGNSWDKDQAAITKEFKDALDDCGLHRPGIGFYTLRHVFRTAADGCRDQVAVNSIMGHADASMAGVYRERIDDSRLKAVTDFVHVWLFG